MLTVKMHKLASVHVFRLSKYSPISVQKLLYYKLLHISINEHKFLVKFTSNCNIQHHASKCAISATALFIS